MIKNARRTHFTHLWSDKPNSRPSNKPQFYQQPDLHLKASGESHINLLHCVSPQNRRAKRFTEEIHSSLKHLRQDTLSYGGINHVKWSSVGGKSRPGRTFYELLRCYSDPSVKENELSQCAKELHHLARTNDEIFKNMVNLTLERSHLNFSTWSGLVGSIVVRGDYDTQKILSRVILSEKPRPLSVKEHAKLLEAIHFIPAGPLYPELVQALLSLHKNSSKSDEITVRAMLVTSGLVRRCHDAGYNRSLSDSIAKHLHQSFKTHPARFHDEESQSHDNYVWSHVCAFGNLGHISSLDLITRYLNHDSSGIRYFAVSALRKLPSQYTDHHLLRTLRNDEHVTVKAGVIEVLIERRQNLTDDLREAIEDALWKSEEGDELDSKINEFLENNNEESYHVIKRLRKRRSIIRRKKRALIPALKPREFHLGVVKEWKRAFGGSQAGAEAIMRFTNEVKLKIGIFGGSFEVNLDNLALFEAHVIKWSFKVVDGKATFVMGAGFKNDIPKDLIHTVADTADSVLRNIDGVASIFTQHIQKFLDKLKTYLPFIPDAFLDFITETVNFLGRTIHLSRFGKFFDQILVNLHSAWGIREFWLKIGDLTQKLSLNLGKIKLSTGSFSGAFNFLNKLVDLFSRLRIRLPRNFPLNFSIKKFLNHINGPFDFTYDAIVDYFQNLGFSLPKAFFKMFHFNVTLDLIPRLGEFKTTTLRLVNFGNIFLEMLSIFREMFNINIPRISLPDFNMNVYDDKDFDFGLRFDWRMALNFSVDFSSPDFALFRKLFRYLTEIFQNLKNPNVNFEQFFREILPKFRINFNWDEIFDGTTDSKTSQDLINASDVKWFKFVVTIFENLVNRFDSELFDLSNIAKFLEEVLKTTGDFLKGPLENVCKLQNFMLKSARTLEVFGQDLEKATIVRIGNVANVARQAIEEVHNMSLFVDEFIDELKQNLSSTAKTFVEQYLTELEGSLGSVKELADIAIEFSVSTTEKLSGLCYKTANISGNILDKIQSVAQNAVGEIADFLTSNSGGIVKFVNGFKLIIKHVEDWHQTYLAKHLGKVAIISQTIDEFLSLVKRENNIFSDIHKVFKNINNVIQHLNNLPTHAQKAYSFAEKVTEFATNAKAWETEFGRLNLRKQFKLDFDEQLRKLCDEFQSFSKDTIRQIQGDGLFKTFRKFVVKETDSLISKSVDKLNILKTPLEGARRDLDKMLDSIEEIEAVLVELRPFSKNVSPVLQEILKLPNCSDIYFIFDNIITRCGKEAISFGKQAYDDYTAMKSEVKGFLQLLPDEYENLSSRKCFTGGTCLSNSLNKQAQSISNQMETLKKKFDDINLGNKLEMCKHSVEEVSDIFNSVKNVSKLVKEFSFKDEIVKIKDLARTITGRISGNDDISKVRPV